MHSTLKMMSKSFSEPLLYLWLRRQRRNSYRKLRENIIVTQKCSLCGKYFSFSFQLNTSKTHSSGSRFSKSWCLYGQLKFSSVWNSILARLVSNNNYISMSTPLLDYTDGKSHTSDQSCKSLFELLKLAVKIFGHSIQKATENSTTACTTQTALHVQHVKIEPSNLNLL